MGGMYLVYCYGVEGIMRDTIKNSGRATHFYLHRYHKGGMKAPLPCGRHVMVCDVYECQRKPRVGESGTDYCYYALQNGKLVKTSYETHVVE
jgi:hypothetical protein